MRNFYDDYKRGIINEIKFKAFLDFKYDFDIKHIEKVSDRYAELDFKVGENKFAELKSRTFKHNEFPTTMIGENKMIKAENNLKKNIDTDFYFLFTDGLYFWKYNEEEIACITDGGRCDRGRYEYKPHAYIPIKYLKFITKEIKSKPIKR